MTARGASAHTLLAVAALAAAACSRSTPSTHSTGDAPSAAASASAVPDPELIPKAKEVARQFFLAADAEDCPALVRMRRDPWTDEACEDFVRHYKANKTKLKSFSEAKHDGRNRNIVLVTALLDMPGKDDKEHRWVLPVEKRGDAWKVGYW